MSVVRLYETTLSCKPTEFKKLLFKFGKVVVVVDKIENDLSRTCRIGEKLIVEPGRPIISAAKRYIIGINNKLIYSKVMQKRDKSVVCVLGIGEVLIKDILIWCNARKMCGV
jgi:hypothetical protein